MKHLREIFKTGQDSNSSETNFSLRNQTCFSTGEKSIRELYSSAVSNIVTHISITDKSTISAYTKGRAMNIGEGFGLKVIPGVESIVKLNNKIITDVNMLLYFSEKLLKDSRFIKDIKDAIEMGNENGGTDLTDILYLRNRYDLANIITNPFELKNLNTQEIDAFINSMVNKGEIDGIFSKKNQNPNLVNGYELPLFIRPDENEDVDEFGITSKIENRDFEILSKKGDLGIMIGRLNPPHIGHIRVIKKALRENGKLFLFLGSANKLDEKNPFTAVERLFFLNFYFKQEIVDGSLIIGTLDDVGNFEKWVSNLGEKVTNIFPNFKGKVNIYGGNLKEDIAISAINEYEESLGLENVNYREIEREDFLINHKGKKVEISATSVRDALSNKDYELAKKLMNDEIGDLVIHKWKESREEITNKKMFFMFPPEIGKEGKLHRNFKKAQKIKKQVDSDFNSDNIVSDIESAEIIIPVGGDGSLLYAIKEYGHLGIPFYPIAAGSVNFIPASFTHPYQILTEENETLKLPLLDVAFYDDKGKLISNKVALNDVFLNVESGTVGILTVEGDEYPNRLVRGDGLIISTPIGSTAYTKNAGGNVLPLNNNVLSITDIVSSKGISHTVDADQSFTIDVIRGNFVAHADGTKIQNISRVEVKKSSKNAQVIIPIDEDFRRNRYK